MTTTTETIAPTEEQLQAMGQFIADYNGLDAEDYIDDIVITQDAFDSFGPSWNERGIITDDDDFGVPARYFERVQTRKGETRVSVWVMDFGNFRATCVL